MFSLQPQDQCAGHSSVHSARHMPATFRELPAQHQAVSDQQSLLLLGGIFLIRHQYLHASVLLLEPCCFVCMFSFFFFFLLLLTLSKLPY